MSCTSFRGTSRGTHRRGPLDLRSWGALGSLREAERVLSRYMGPSFMGPFLKDSLSHGVLSFRPLVWPIHFGQKRK